MIYNVNLTKRQRGSTWWRHMSGGDGQFMFRS